MKGIIIRQVTIMGCGVLARGGTTSGLLGGDEVGNGFELDLVALFREAQAAQAFVEARVHRAATDDGQRFGLAAQAILQQEG